MNELKGLDVGGPRFPGVTVKTGTGYDLTGGGADIWGPLDQFHFAHLIHHGDFDFQFRVEALGESHAYTKAGIMVRESLEAGAVHVFHLVFPDNRPRNNNSGGYEAQTRASTGEACTAVYPPLKGIGPVEFPVDYPHVWLRLTRKGNYWTAWSGNDGMAWKVYAQLSLTLPVQVYLGLGLTAHDDTKMVRARFREVRLV